MKTTIYIDGQNFLYKAADILIAEGRINDKQDLNNISIRTLMQKVLGEDDLVIKFYGAKLRIYRDTPELIYKSTRMVDSNRKLKNSLNKEKIQSIDGGKLKLRDGDRCTNCDQQTVKFQEKGVDVKIAVDIILDSLQPHIERQVLVSSDTDLIPAIKAVRKNNKELVYVGFSDKITQALSREASETQTIRDQEIIDAFDIFNPQVILPVDELTVTADPTKE
ncbi:NYN domain-containing protein [Candidatus Saccharibacteria bacterium]|nr:NYN domain-containing protein [Candidatus Saccharibacteria bacterium]